MASEPQPGDFVPVLHAEALINHHKRQCPQPCIACPELQASTQPSRGADTSAPARARPFNRGPEGLGVATMTSRPPTGQVKPPGKGGRLGSVKKRSVADGSAIGLLLRLIQDRLQDVQTKESSMLGREAGLLTLHPRQLHL